MKWLFENLNNREIALIIFVLVIIMYVGRSKDVRQSFAKVIQQLFHKEFLVVYLLYSLYLIGMIYFLKSVNLWDKGATKDTILWILGVGFVLIFNVSKAKKDGYFKQLVVDTVKGTIIVEFLINFYTFSLPVELIFIPVITFLPLVKMVANKKDDAKSRDVERYTQKLLNLIGVMLISYVIYRFINEPQSLITFQSFQSFILPICFTFLFLPFVYTLSLIFLYEELFVRINIQVKDRRYRRFIKFQVYRVCNFNLSRLRNVIKNFHVFTAKQTANIYSYVLEVSKPDYKRPF